MTESFSFASVKAEVVIWSVFLVYKLLWLIWRNKEFCLRQSRKYQKLSHQFFSKTDISYIFWVYDLYHPMNITER
jgi:hypothetical protein